MRAQIEADAGIDAVDIYGLSEVMGPGVASECVESKDGPVIWEDHFYPEIIDPDTGAVLPDGSEGELVFTSLTKEAFPIIRYRTRDLTRLLPPTSRSMRRMGKIVGRSDDMLIIRGVNLFPTQVEELVLQTEGLSGQYQLVVSRDGNAGRSGRALRTAAQPTPAPTAKTSARSLAAPHQDADRRQHPGAGGPARQHRAHAGGQGPAGHRQSPALSGPATAAPHPPAALTHRPAHGPTPFRRLRRPARADPEARGRAVRGPGLCRHLDEPGGRRLRRLQGRRLPLCARQERAAGPGGRSACAAPGSRGRTRCAPSSWRPSRTCAS